MVNASKMLARGSKYQKRMSLSITKAAAMITRQKIPLMRVLMAARRK